MPNAVAGSRFCDFGIATAFNDVKIDVAPVPVGRREIWQRVRPVYVTKDFVHAMWAAAPGDDVVINIEQATQVSSELRAKIGKIGAPDSAVWSKASAWNVRDIKGLSTPLF
jgi:hypothetical protein